MDISKNEKITIIPTSEIPHSPADCDCTGEENLCEVCGDWEKDCYLIDIKVNYDYLPRKAHKGCVERHNAHMWHEPLS